MEKKLLVIRNFEGTPVATIQAEKPDKSGILSNATYTQVLKMYMGNNLFGGVIVNYSKTERTVRVSTDLWNLWFATNVSTFSADGVFRFTKSSVKTAHKNLIEFNDDSQGIEVYLTVIAVLEAVRLSPQLSTKLISFEK